MDDTDSAGDANAADGMDDTDSAGEANAADGTLQTRRRCFRVCRMQGRKDEPREFTLRK